MKNYVIDFHVHILNSEQQTQSLIDLMIKVTGSPEKLHEFEALYSQPENFIALMDKDGVDYSIILSEHCPLVSGIVDSDKTLSYCANQPRLIPFGTLNPSVHGNLANSLKNLKKQGIQGLKLYPTYNHFYINEPKMYPLYEAATELDLPILIHTGTSVFKNSRLKYGNPIDIDDVAVDFPDLKLIMSHGGRMAWYLEAMTMIRLHKNVYIDLAGLSLSKLLVNFPDFERFSHKFVLGTDWPQISAKAAAWSIRKLKLSETATNNILGNNAAKILKLAL